MLKKLKRESYPALLIVFGIGFITCTYSREAGFYPDSLKFLLFSFSTFLLSLYITVQKTLFEFPKSTLIRYSIVGVALATLIATYFSQVGAPVLGLSTIALWTILVLCTMGIAKSISVSRFVSGIIYFQAFFTVASLVILAFFQISNGLATLYFFSNVNHLSDYIAIALLQLMFFFEIEKDLFRRKIAALFFVLGTLLLLLLGGRTALLGLMLGVFAYVSQHPSFRVKFRSAKRRSFFYSLGAATSLLFLFFALQTKGGLSSMQTRFAHWMNTLYMIRDYPWGVGPGSFEFVYEGYNAKYGKGIEVAEFSHVNNTHNSYLEIMAEIGVVGSLALFSLLLFIFREAVKNKSEPLAVRWLTCFALFFGVNAALAFPQDLPFTLYFSGIVLGVALGLLKSSPVKISPFLRNTLLVFAVVVLGIFSKKAFSEYLSTHNVESQRLEAMELACRIDQENWRACRWQVLGLIEKGDFELAQSFLSQLEKRFGRYAAVEEMSAMLAYKTGQKEKACAHLKYYDALFNYKSTKHDLIVSECP